MPIEQRELGKWGKRGQLLSVFIVLCAVIYGGNLYFMGAERDRNLVYQAMFFDDLAVDLYNKNASFDSVAFAAGTASAYCDLYELEHRTLEKNRYKPLCDAIKQRRSLLLICSDMSLECNESSIVDLESMIEEAEPIAKDLKDNPP